MYMWLAITWVGKLCQGYPGYLPWSGCTAMERGGVGLRRACARGSRGTRTLRAFPKGRFGPQEWLQRYVGSKEKKRSGLGCGEEAWK